MKIIINLIRNIMGRIIQYLMCLRDFVFTRGACDFATWVELDELGIDKEKGNKYQPTFVPINRIIKKKYNVSQEDAVIDIGCGKGYAMYMLHKSGFGVIDGYDLNQRLVDCANNNFKMLGYDNCHAFCGNAETYCDYEKYNYFYIFNSVPETVFIRMMNNIEESLSRKPRDAVLILVNPECRSIVDKSMFFRVDYSKKGIMSWMDVLCYKTV